MSETGQSWRRPFEAAPSSAPAVRRWTRDRITHPDAPAVADELLVAVLATEPAAVEVTLSTAGDRARITVHGAARPLDWHADEPGGRIVAALSTCSRTTHDARGLWAQLELADPCPTQT